MVLNHSGLEKGPNETDIEHADRLKLAAVDAREYAADQQAVNRKLKYTAWGAGAAAFAMFCLVLIALWFNWWSDDKIIAHKDSVIAAQKAEIAGLKERPPTQVVQGFTEAQCKAVAVDITNQSCQGKTETVTKTKTVYRDRLVAVPKAPQNPCGASCPPVARPAPVEPRHHVCQVIVNDKLVADFGSREANYLREYVKPHGEGPKCAALRAQYFKDHPDVRFAREEKS